MTELLVPTERRLLLDIAAEAIAVVLRTGRREPVTGLAEFQQLPAALQEPGATFVTLRREQRLLGCVGTMEAYQPLAVDVAVHAVAAAFDDPRVPAVTAADFAAMSIHVSLLGPLEALGAGSLGELLDALRAGVDGLLVQALGRRATFLPSVWEQLPDPEQFVAALWRKAGLPPGHWTHDLVVSRYVVEEFGDEGPRSL